MGGTIDIPSHGSWNHVDEENLGFAELGLEDSVKHERLLFEQVCGDQDQLGAAPTDNRTLRHHTPHKVESTSSRLNRNTEHARRRTCMSLAKADLLKYLPKPAPRRFPRHPSNDLVIGVLIRIL